MNALTTQFFCSPLSRALETSAGVFSGKLRADQAIVVSELLRGNIGTDVCNARRPVHPLPALPPPFVTGCQAPPSSLIDVSGSLPGVRFAFPVRPAGGQSLGLCAYEDPLWRSDAVESLASKVCRVLTFVGQVFQCHADDARIAVVVTHSELIAAVFQAFDLVAPPTANCELFAFMIDCLD